MHYYFLVVLLLRFAFVSSDAAVEAATTSTSEEEKACGAVGSNQRWDPSADQPCNIRRMPHSELIRRFGSLGLPNLYPYPLVIFPDDDKNTRNENFANLTTQEHLPLQFASNFNVTLTGSDSLSSYRRTIPLKQYLHEVMHKNGGQTSPDQLGNETWYLFGETHSAEWKKFLQQYNLPSCHSCTPMHYHQGLIALSFGIGNVGSGVQWHLHGPGFSETIHGRKHWVLYPPENRPNYNLDYASRHWMEYYYPTLDNWTEAEFEIQHQNHDQFLQRWKQRAVNSSADNIPSKGPSSKRPFECTINSGEMIYFPDGWHHATINLDRYTVFVSSFTTEHEDL